MPSTKVQKGEKLTRRGHAYGSDQVRPGKFFVVLDALALLEGIS